MGLWVVHTHRPRAAYKMGAVFGRRQRRTHRAATGAVGFGRTCSDQGQAKIVRGNQPFGRRQGVGAHHLGEAQRACGVAGCERRCSLIDFRDARGPQPGVCGASRDYLACQGVPTTIPEMKKHYLVGFDESMGQRHKEVQRLERCFMPEKIVHRSSSFVGQMQATLAGIGLGAHDCVLADAEPTLQRIMPESFEYRMEIWLVTHADMRRSARIRAVYDFLAAELVAEQAKLTGKPAKAGKSKAA